MFQGCHVIRETAKVLKSSKVPQMQVSRLTMLHIETSSHKSPNVLVWCINCKMTIGAMQSRCETQYSCFGLLKNNVSSMIIHKKMSTVQFHTVKNLKLSCLRKCSHWRKRLVHVSFFKFGAQRIVIADGLVGSRLKKGCLVGWVLSTCKF